MFVLLRVFLCWNWPGAAGLLLIRCALGWIVWFCVMNGVWVFGFWYRILKFVMNYYLRHWILGYFAALIIFHCFVVSDFFLQVPLLFSWMIFEFLDFGIEYWNFLWIIICVIGVWRILASLIILHFLLWVIFSCRFFSPFLLFRDFFKEKEMVLKRLVLFTDVSKWI